MKSNIILTFLSLIAFLGCSGQDSTTLKKNEKTASPNTESTYEDAILGGGCFWCTEAVFEKIKGVHKVVSGYAGGKTPNPTYKQICTGLTGHAEVIRISFDSKIISFGQLLDIFGACHDPTTLNRQGADVGTQYRSTIMYLNEDQRVIAEAWKKKIASEFNDPIVTEIVKAPKFYDAEDYHQDYYVKNPNQGYCNFVIRPKLKKLNLE